MSVTTHKSDIYASNLYFLSLALSIPAFPIHLPTYTPTTYLSRTGFLITTTLAFALLAALGFGVRVGKRWVKVVFVLLSVLSIGCYLYKLPSTYAFDYSSVLNLISTFFYIWATIIVAKDLLTRRSVTATGQA